MLEHIHIENCVELLRCRHIGDGPYGYLASAQGVINSYTTSKLRIRFKAYPAFMIAVHITKSIRPYAGAHLQNTTVQVHVYLRPYVFLPVPRMSEYFKF